MTDVRPIFYAWRTKHPAEAEDPFTAFAVGYRFGGGDALRKSAQMGDIVATMRDLIWWLEVAEGEEMHA